MASPSTSLSLDSAFQPLFLLSSHNFSPPSFSTSSHALLSLRKSHPLSLKSFPRFSPPHALDPSVEAPPIPGGPFLDPGSFSRLRTLKEFRYVRQFDHGRLEIRSMEADEVDPASLLLATSFADSMWWAGGYVTLLAFLVKQYVIERWARIPHMTILLGFYKERDGEEEARLACIAEISFDALGANAAVPTPVPPKEYPYLSNMTVRKTFRRRGIGGHLLKACEELITQMKAERKVYLHCRMIDAVPFGLYKKAGYKVVKTDSILIWLTLQRRKYLMLKELPPVPDDSKSDNTDYNDHLI